MYFHTKTCNCAVFWPSIINYQLLPPHSVLYWPSTQLYHLVKRTVEPTGSFPFGWLTVLWVDVWLHTELHGLDWSQCATNFEWSPCPLDLASVFLNSLGIWAIPLMTSPRNFNKILSPPSLISWCQYTWLSQYLGRVSRITLEGPVQVIETGPWATRV